MTIKLYKNDIPADLDLGDVVAVDTEAMGLNNHRDRLCVVQLSSGDGKAHLVQFERDNDYAAPNLKKLLSDPNVLKIFHFARFDVAIIQKYMGIDCAPVYCTKIASKLVRTFTDRHGLKELCKEFLSIDLSKQQQSSDWGTEELSSDQKKYAASDVLYLHELKEKLDKMLEREGRMDLAQSCFNFLPTRARLDLNGWSDPDIFQH
jgi:ribonuclease D